MFGGGGGGGRGGDFGFLLNVKLQNSGLPSQRDTHIILQLVEELLSCRLELRDHQVGGPGRHLTLWLPQAQGMASSSFLGPNSILGYGFPAN